jgi:hypothetical protein
MTTQHTPSATSSAHTQGPWRVTRSVNADVYAGEEHFAVQVDPECGSAAPDGYNLAFCMRNACEDHLSELNEQMSHGNESASEEELDDLQAQIDNWYVLLDTCNGYFAKVEAR